MKIQNFGMAMLLPGLGCWSQDQTTARLGEHQRGRKILNLKFSYFRFIEYYMAQVRHAISQPCILANMGAGRNRVIATLILKHLQEFY